MERSPYLPSYNTQKLCQAAGLTPFIYTNQFFSFSQISLPGNSDYLDIFRSCGT